MSDVSFLEDKTFFCLLNSTFTGYEKCTFKKKKRKLTCSCSLSLDSDLDLDPVNSDLGLRSSRLRALLLSQHMILARLLCGNHLNCQLKKIVKFKLKICWYCRYIG